MQQAMSTRENIFLEASYNTCARATALRSAAHQLAGVLQHLQRLRKLCLHLEQQSHQASCVLLSPAPCLCASVREASHRLLLQADAQPAVQRRHLLRLGALVLLELLS